MYVRARARVGIYKKNKIKGKREKRKQRKREFDAGENAISVVYNSKTVVASDSSLIKLVIIE